MLAYLSRYTHRVAIANGRLIACDRTSVTFRWKDYRAEGRDRHKVMTPATAEFIRRFLIHVLPHGFHRIRHYGLFASGTRAGNIARARRLLDVLAAQPSTADTATSSEDSEPKPLSHPCSCCGGRMIIIETFQRGASPRYRPAASTAVIRIDTSRSRSARGKIAGLHFCFAGSPAMTRFALAPPSIAVLPFDLRYATPVLPVAIGRPGSSSPRSLPKQTFNAPHQQTASDKTPITFDARPHHHGAGIRKPSQELT